MKNSATAAKFLLSACLIVIFNQVSGCEVSWNRYGDRCYRIFQPTVTRYSAMIICSLKGSNLVSITDASTLDFLSQHVSHSSHSKLWVGLEKKEDELVWFDGTKYVGNQSWVQIPESSEYRNSTVDLFGSGCFAYNGTLVVKEACYESHAFICEYHVSDNRTHKSCLFEVEPEHSFIGETTGNCLFRTEDRTYKNGVEALCQRKRGHFVDFEDVMRDGLGALSDRKVLVDESMKYWTNFAWNGTRLFRANGNAVPQDYPISVVEGSGECITVQYNLTDLLSTKFYQTMCGELAFGMCSLDNQATDDTTTTRRSVQLMLSLDGDNCPEGYNWKTDRSKNFCYWETSFETDQLSWNDAEKYCQGYGGHLGSFHSSEEEKIGLSFQYGSLSHDYWIGLAFDPDDNTYKWTDGTPLNYTNWAPGHPDHKDKRLQCVSMHAAEKHWTSSLCGILSWFICKVPKRNHHPMPFLPTPTPLESCEKNFFESSKSSWYFKGSCYFPVVETFSWHRAKQYCENQGGSLASIHSTDEIGFLLRLLHDSSMETNRVWIGLNSFGSDGNFKWTDYTGVDFTYFATNEPDNFQNQEKCVNMNTRDGQWNDENCNAALGFVCKRTNDTSVSIDIPTTQDPRIGNCKKGWIDHVDRCYYIGGKREKDRLNWTEASEFCRNSGGYLTSIRNSNEQSFLAYLLQTLGVDAWIGLHDTIQSGRYYWLDNSDLEYTNWSPGEPSFFGIAEDCVKMVYYHFDSGVWKDDDCVHKLGFICQTSKDPNLPPPPSDRGFNCVHPEGWLKLDSMCFKMFEDSALSWHEAGHACRKKGGNLVSISDQRVKAVVSYVASEINQPFLIGLRYDKGSRTVNWLNNFPVKLSDWEKNEPSLMTEDTCFASTSEGYWKKASCDEKMPYLCQITTGKPKKLNKFVGNCPDTSSLWVSGSFSYCYILERDFRLDWYAANLMCFRYGSHLISLHSMEELEDIKELIKPGIRSVFLGLMRNKKGGFTWVDDSPVNFENWDEAEPANADDQCVEMLTHNMKWRVTSCMSKKHYICMNTKGTLVKDDPEAAEYAAAQLGLSTAAVCAIIFSILIIAIITVAAVVLFRKKTYRLPQFRRQERNSSVSFENAMYDVCSSSMVFNEENKS